MVLVIDYGTSNIASVINMIKKLGSTARASPNVAEVETAERLVLPGVGAFDTGMRSLQSRGLDEAVRRAAAAGVPVLGVCLGMQLLARKSEEGSGAGLGLIDADVVRFAPSLSVRVPHMGWNEIEPRVPHPLLDGLPRPSRFYFVHSFHVVCDHPDDVVAVARHGVAFHAVVARGNVAGVQFHPEKSHRFGMRLLDNFLRWKPR